MRRLYHLLILIKYKLVLPGYLQYATCLSSVSSHDPLPFFYGILRHHSLPRHMSYDVVISPFRLCNRFFSSHLSSEILRNRKLISLSLLIIIYRPRRHDDGSSVSLPDDDDVFIHFYLGKRVFIHLLFYSACLILRACHIIIINEGKYNIY